MSCAIAPFFEDVLKKYWAVEERKRIEALERGKQSRSPYAITLSITLLLNSCSVNLRSLS